MNEVTLNAIPGMPEIQPGDDLAQIIGDALENCDCRLQNSDVLVVAQKVVSKADNLIVDLGAISPTTEALELAARLNKDPRKCEVVLQESRRVVKSFKHPHQGEGTLICEHISGHISANAGVDQSNLGDPNTVLLLPRDPDASARELHKVLAARFGCRIGLIISDTFGRPWRMGQVNVAIGAAGLPAIKSEIGNQDAHGRDLLVTAPAFSDEIAAASGLAISKASQTPVVLVRGLNWEAKEEGQASDLVRKKSEDMFR